MFPLMTTARRPKSSVLVSSEGMMVELGVEVFCQPSAGSS
jgi:hypothetical protein